MFRRFIVFVVCILTLAGMFILQQSASSQQLGGINWQSNDGAGDPGDVDSEDPSWSSGEDVSINPPAWEWRWLDSGGGVPSGWNWNSGSGFRPSGWMFNPYEIGYKAEGQMTDPTTGDRIPTRWVWTGESDAIPSNWYWTPFGGYRPASNWLWNPAGGYIRSPSGWRPPR